MGNKARLIENNSNLTDILSAISGLDTAEEARQGKCTWAKYTLVNGAKGEFEDYVVNDLSGAYPEDGEQDGYWYKRVEEFSVTNGLVKEYLASTGTINANTFIEFVSTSNIGSETEWYSSNAYGSNVECVLLSEDKVLVLHGLGDYGSLYACVLTISDHSVSHGSQTQVLNARVGESYVHACKISSSKVVYICGQGGGSTMYCGTLSISGTTVTVNTQTNFSTSGSISSYSNQNAIVPIDSTNNNFAIFYCGDSNTLYCANLTINNTSVSVSNQKSLGIANGGPVRAFYISENKILIGHGNSSNNNLYALSILSMTTSSSTLGTTYVIPDTPYTLNVTGSSSNLNADLVKIDSNKFMLLKSVSSTRLLMPISIISGEITFYESKAIHTNGSYSSFYSRLFSDGSSSEFVVATGASTSSTYTTQLYIQKGSYLNNSMYISEPVLATSAYTSVGYIWGGSYLGYDDRYVVINAMSSNGYRGAIVVSYETTIKESETKHDGLLISEASTTDAGKVYV